MPRRGFTLKLRPLEVLPDDKLATIHQAVLDVLWETGVRMESPWALDFLAGQGCRVDRESLRVRFPAELVEACLAQAARSFVCRAPDPVNDLLMASNTVYFSNSAGMETVDLETFEPRPPTKAEFADCVRVMDYLPTIDQLGCYPYFGYAGIDPLMGIPEGVVINMQCSSKHQAACCSNDCELFTIQMAQAVGHELTGTITSTSPLTWNESAITAARRLVEAGFPISTVDGTLGGGTGPATVPGWIVVSNAEHLAMLTLIQRLHPGHRVIIGHFALAMNMATGAPAFGSITSSLNNVAFNQVWRHYGLPVGNGSPGYTSAKKMDFQAGYEKAMGALLSALSGSNSILLHLGVSSEMSAHPAQAILDHDIAGMVGRFIEGEEVNDETLAVALIQQIGPVPGQYLAETHTSRWWRKEQYLPIAADRQTYPVWLTTGKKGALDRAQERLTEILAKHHPQPLSESQEADLARILAEAREYYKKRE
jgi:trimethylamine---corrinoid protein Co-methyltransferase